MKKKKILLNALEKTSLLLALFLISCGGSGGGGGSNKDNDALLPVIGNIEVKSFSELTAKISSSVIISGGSGIDDRGFILDGAKKPCPAPVNPAPGDFQMNFEDLAPNTSHKIKAYATNGTGTVYTKEISFTTLAIKARNGATDVDGNKYDTVHIGKQTWMKQNLAVTHFRDNSLIPLVEDDAAWMKLTVPGVCIYKNNVSYKAVYGCLYNFSAIADSRGIAPIGWHIATPEDWAELYNYLGDWSISGGHIKEAGYSHWLDPNYTADNSSGFTALAAGYRSYFNGEFLGFYEVACWWTSKLYNNAKCYYNSPQIDCTNVLNQKNGLSARCVKDKK